MIVQKLLEYYEEKYDIEIIDNIVYIRGKVEVKDFVFLRAVYHKKYKDLENIIVYQNKKDIRRML